MAAGSRKKKKQLEKCLRPSWKRKAMKSKLTTKVNLPRPVLFRFSERFKKSTSKHNYWRARRKWGERGKWKRKWLDRLAKLKTMRDVAAISLLLVVITEFSSCSRLRDVLEEGPWVGWTTLRTLVFSLYIYLIFAIIIIIAFFVPVHLVIILHKCKSNAIFQH